MSGGVAHSNTAAWDSSFRSKVHNSVSSNQYMWPYPHTT